MLLALLLGFGWLSAAPAAAQVAELPGQPACDLAELPEGEQALLCMELHLDKGDVAFGDITSDFEPFVVRQWFSLGPDLGLTAIDGGQGTGVTFPAFDVDATALSLDGLADVSLPVRAAIQPTGDIGTSDVDVAPILFGEGEGKLATVDLPLLVRPQHLLLGDDCTIGTREAPINLGLDLVLGEAFNAYNYAMTLSDETFAIPGATGCGPLGTGALLGSLGLDDANVFNQVIDDQVGLPSSSGANHLRFEGIFAVNICFELAPGLWPPGCGTP